jgi:flagellar biosynthesis protein FlhG
MMKRAPVDFSPEERNLYDVLWTHRGASDEEVRRAYKRQRDVFQVGSLALSSLLTDEQILVERGRVEEAQKTLLDPVRRRSYDLSFFPDASAETTQREDHLDEARLAEQAMLREQLAHEIHAETEFTGALLKRVRESQGILLEEIGRTTKISMAHLRAIEEDAFENLPAEVYTRGFVGQVAQLLRLDATQATRTYIRRMRAAKRGHLAEVSD